MTIQFRNCKTLIDNFSILKEDIIKYDDDLRKDHSKCRATLIIDSSFLNIGSKKILLCSIEICSIKIDDSKVKNRVIREIGDMESSARLNVNTQDGDINYSNPRFPLYFPIKYRSFIKTGVMKKADLNPLALYVSRGKKRDFIILQRDDNSKIFLTKNFLINNSLR
ncbi:unnamed protein product [Gordionus sp. m RMFG-2023]